MAGRRWRFLYQLPLIFQGGRKPGKHGKPRKVREFGKLSKSQGNLREISGKFEFLWEKPGKLKENEKYVT